MLEYLRLKRSPLTIVFFFIIITNNITISYSLTLPLLSIPRGSLELGDAEEFEVGPPLVMDEGLVELTITVGDLNDSVVDVVLEIEEEIEVVIVVDGGSSHSNLFFF
ncbi:hypothetical protein LWI28_010944 [Acer negundo]|uniref:Uncharacterized protein n=1 Tax=Acer negundo TaxID=4023 RepID=A0AAD5P1N6_ACENE|nr:hypothetical protein LWI28_010944 [Acer negundo]